MYTISVATQEYLQKLIEFANQEGMFFTVSGLLHEEKPSSPTLRVATPQFKAFCGSEWLTPKGMISEKLAVECVSHYVKVRNLEKDSKILLNEELQTALGTKRLSIGKDELSSLVTSSAVLR